MRARALWPAALSTTLFAAAAVAQDEAAEVRSPDPTETPTAEPTAEPALPLLPAAEPVHAEPSGDDVAAPPTEPQDAFACSADWVTRVYRASHRSVVKIDTGGALGAGFLYPTRRHVATAFHVIALGHPVAVTFYSGKQVAAKVVAVDVAHDLAILELDQDVRSMDVLPLADAPVAELGRPVIAIGHPYGNLGDARHRGLLGWSVTRGIVSGQGPQLIQTDAALNPGNSGGPLLGCDGRVLGVASAKARGEGVGFAVPSVWLKKLAERIGKQAPYEGLWSVELGGGMTFQGNRHEGLLGFTLGVGLVVHDRWVADVAIHEAWDVALPPPPRGVAEVSRVRTAGELGFGHRWLVLSSLPITHVYVGVGGVAAFDQTETVRLVGRLEDPSCTGPDCSFAVDVRDEDETRWFGWPMLRLSTKWFGSVDLSYALLPDVTELRDTVHQGTLTLSL